MPLDDFLYDYIISARDPREALLDFVRHATQDEIAEALYLLWLASLEGETLDGLIS